MSPPQAVLLIDSELRVRFANEAVAGLSACPVDELLHSPLFTCFPPDDEEARAGLPAALAADEIYYFSSTVKRKSAPGVRITYRVSPVPEATPGDGTRAVLVAVATETLRQAPALLESDGEQRFHATYEHTSLSYADAVELYERLEAIMLAERLYLDKNLDLEAVCRRLQTNQLYLSQVVNFFAGENFRDYLNRKRIAHLVELGEAASGILRRHRPHATREGPHRARRQPRDPLPVLRGRVHDQLTRVRGRRGADDGGRPRGGGHPGRQLARVECTDDQAGGETRDVSPPSWRLSNARNP